MSDISLGWRDALIVRENTVLEDIRARAFEFWRWAKDSFTKPGLPQIVVKLDKDAFDISEIKNHDAGLLPAMPSQPIYDLPPLNVRTDFGFRDIQTIDEIASQPKFTEAEIRSKPLRRSIIPFLMPVFG